MTHPDAFVDDVKDRISRDKHLRVENLVKIQSRPCATCGELVVWAAVNNAGKRLPFEPSKLLNNSLKVVIDQNEALEVWPFAPRSHRCDSEKVRAKEEDQWLPTHQHAGISEAGPRHINHKHGGPRDHDHVDLGWGNAHYGETP